MSYHLYLTHHIYGLRIHSFLLMPNHFHLLASLSDSSLPIAMKYFMESTSKEFNHKSGRTNQNWGGRHYKCEIQSNHYFANCYKYVYQNPLRAHLVNKVEQWPYSSLSGLLGNSPILIPLEEDTLLFSGNSLNQDTLHWLNSPINLNDLESMRLGTKKRVFKLRKMSHGRLNPLEQQLI